MEIMSTEKIKVFWLKYEQKIILFVAFCLVAGISFQFGVLQGQKWQQKPLIIEKASDTPGKQVTSQNEASVAPETKSVTVQPAANTSSCAYVGSKSSNKFYLPTCSYAKRVKPENLVCFKSAQEALGQGRIESVCK